jgi:hypothetical protein
MVAGIVFIIAVIFFTGFMLGKSSGHHGGHHRHGHHKHHSMMWHKHPPGAPGSQVGPGANQPGGAPSVAPGPGGPGQVPSSVSPSRTP